MAMPKVKLTLTIEESLVAHAKEMAQRRQLSLSQMVEEFLSSSKAARGYLSTKGMTKAQKLRGIAKSALSGKTDQEIKEMMHKERYGL